MKRDSGEGSVRKCEDGYWECVIQSSYINPKTGNPKRIKRKRRTKTQAVHDAKLALEEWEEPFITREDRRNGRVRERVDRSKPFGEFMEKFIDNQVKPSVTASTYHSYVNTMNANFYNYPIAQYSLCSLNIDDFEEYFQEILKLKSRKTCSFPIQLCRRCCKHLVSRGYMKENYAELAEIPKSVCDEYDRKKEESIKNQKQIFTYEDIRKFYFAFKNNMGQYPVIVLFLLETGLRIGEFASLRNSNIDLENGIIHIVESRSIRYIDNDKTKGVETYSKVPKNGKGRIVPISEVCRECILYMQTQTKIHCKKNTNDLLYPTFSTGKPRTNATMEYCFKDLCDKLEIDRDVRVTRNGTRKGLCLHSLRHTMTTMANTSIGANVVNTALMTGHTAITTENIYTHSNLEALRTVKTPMDIINKER